MKKFSVLVLTILLLYLASFLFMKVYEEDDLSEKIVIIPINGIITTYGGGSSIFATDSSSATSIMMMLKNANKDPKVKGIILEINSPGGAVVASKEVANFIKKIDKPVVAWIREVGASGAYWIASSADKIVADELSITGSIGVSGSYLEFSGIMEEYGIGYEELKSGKYKESGVPFKKLTLEEKNLLQQKLDMIHNFFITDIAKNRNLEKEKVVDLANGIFYLGIEAYNLGLIDVMGSRDEAVKLVEELTNKKGLKVVQLKRKVSLFEILGSISSNLFFEVGRGIGSEIKSSNFEIRA